MPWRSEAKKIRGHMATSGSPLDHEMIEKRLFDPTVPDRTYLSELAAIYRGSNDAKLRAVAGFQLFVVAAATTKSDWAEGPTDRSALDVLAEPDKYLSDQLVLRYLCDQYCKIPPEWRGVLTQLRFHKAGTTSLILVDAEEELYALKLILPRFGNVSTITTATAQYYTSFRKLSLIKPTESLSPIAPKVFASSERWVLMKYIPGDTLTDYTNTYLRGDARSAFRRQGNSRKARRAKNPIPLERLELATGIFIKLCDALDACLRHGFHHLDLSPDNIIIQHDRTGIRDIYLIDFGVNYLVKEHVGSVGLLSRAECFIAPELEHGHPPQPAMADVYSIGMILLEMSSDRPLEKDQINESLDTLWQTHQGLAGIVEDMIDKSPCDRLMGIQRDSLVFTKTKFIVTDAVELIKHLSAKPRSHLKRIGEYVNGVIPFESLDALWTQWDEGDDLLNSEDRRLLHFSVLVQCLHIIAVTAFLGALVFPLSDKRLCDMVHACLSPINFPKLPMWNNGLAGKINGFLPGRLVALSFSLVLSQYYRNVFATVTVRGIKLKSIQLRLRATELLLRLHPFLGAGPICYALVFDPKAWAYCSAAGLAGICLNNALTYSLVVTECRYSTSGLEINDITIVSGGRPSSMLRDEKGSFSRWWLLICEYMMFLAILGFLLSRGFAQDEWLYSLFVSIGVNMLMMLRYNCYIKAPGVRTMLQRVIWRLKRLDAKVSLVLAAGPTAVATGFR